jgi:hypothetical protein
MNGKKENPMYRPPTLVVMYPSPEPKKHDLLIKEFEGRELILSQKEHVTLRMTEELARKFLEILGHTATHEYLARLMRGESFVGVFNGRTAPAIGRIMNGLHRNGIHATVHPEEYTLLYDLFFKQSGKDD